MFKNLMCTHCRKEFPFTDAERDFLLSKGFEHEPKHCSNCRLVLRNWRKSVAGEISSPITEVACDQCGVQTMVPFKPVGHRPVYCRQCQHEKRQRRQPDND
jgi:CxxC-x17-CxxC domain-containing protein